MKLKSSQKEKIEQLAQQFNLSLIVLFGFQLKEETNFSSDFDIAYFSKEKIGTQKKVDLNCELMDVFETDKIDLVNLNEAGLLLRYKISRNSQLLFGNKMDYLNFKAVAFKQYVEAKPLLEMRDDLLKKRHKFLKETIHD